MTAKRLVVIGGSSGAVEAVRLIAAALPASLEAAVAVVIHVAPDSPGVLAEILARESPLVVSSVCDGEAIEAGHLYVARPDYHLLVLPGKFQLTKGPRENRFRPAVDPLFRSAAQVYGPAAIGVVLTGNLDDGTSGLWAIKRLGGIAVVQDPADALYPSMPSSAAEHVDVDYLVPLSEIPALLTRLAALPPDQRGAPQVPDSLGVEVDISRGKNAREAGVESLGEFSPFACPECHGVLLQLKEAHPLRFRCHTGHAYSAESLLAAVDQGIEDALWNAVRALEEGSLLLDHLAGHYAAFEPGQPARRFAERAHRAHAQAEGVRLIATSGEEPAERG